MSRATGGSSNGFRLFAELNREQLRAAAPDSLLVLPIGATEQHGPHLATGMDFITVEAIAHEAARIAGESIPVIVAPTLPFGSSHHHLVFGATLSFKTETYFRVLTDLLESLVTDGFRSIFILNGHGGNHELAYLAVRDIVLNHQVRAAAASYWNLASDDLIAAGAADKRNFVGHAGEFETSLMLAHRPELVTEPRPFRAGPHETKLSPLRDERYGFWSGIDGYTDTPAAATAENGAVWRKAVIHAVARTWVDYYNS